MMHLNADQSVMIVHCDTEEAGSPTGHCRCAVEIPMNGLKLPAPEARNHILDELSRQGWKRVVYINEGMKVSDICPCDVEGIKEAWADRTHVCY
jgi:hypothetical protein